MQGRHQSSGRRLVGAWAVIAPLALIAGDRLRAQEAPVGAGRTDRDPVMLAADRIATWDEGAVRWVRLSGRAGVFRGLDGVRAREAVVRVQSLATPRRPSYRVDVYAEGEAPADGPPTQGARGRRWSVPETFEVQIRRPFDGGEVVPLAQLPEGDPVVGRALAEFHARRAPDEPRPQPRPTLPPIPTDAAVSVPASPGGPSAPDRDVRPVTLFQIEPDQDADGLSPAPRRVPSVVEAPPPPPSPTVDSPFADPSATQFRRGGPGVPELPEPTLPEIPLLPEFDADPDGPEVDLPEIVPLPDGDGPRGRSGDDYSPGDSSIIPLTPGTQRVVNIYPLNPGLTKFRRLARTSDGTDTYVVTGGVQIVVDDPEFGTVDITSKDAVIWTRSGRGGSLSVGSATQAVDDPLEVYLEGDVELRRDERRLAGVEDQIRYQASRFYADLKAERFYALDAELEQYAPGLLMPLRTLADTIAQYREFEPGPDGEVPVDEAGRPVLGLPRIRARNAVTTGSPFANPGYRFRSNTIDLFKLAPGDRRGPLRRRLLNPVDEPTGSDVYLVDARNNFFFMGPVPVFYWPRFLTTTEDINPPLEQISFRTNNLFGQMILTDWDGFKLFGLRQPAWVDKWNIDIDYLSDRGPALGGEFGYFGDDFSTDLFGTDLLPNVDTNYFGYLDLWGIYDEGSDNLGAGPAITTDGPPLTVAFRNNVPTFQEFRGRALFRHMQSFLPRDADPLDDFRVQLEAAYLSDRHFLEQYFKRVFDQGLDQRTRVYAIRQWRTRALTAQVEAMPMDWFTQSQWFPLIDYYRLGGAPFGGIGRYFTYYQRTGVSYANTQTASEVNNPDIFFGFLPNDPTSLTSGPFRTGRLYTNHELNLPIQLRSMRLIPYAQGQLMGWDNQYANPLPSIGFNPALEVQDYIRGPQGSTIGRAWGAYGARAELAFHRPFPRIESELFNVHGLMHKAVLYADYRNAFSTLPLNRIGVQDTLDDNTYELVRRYFALNDYNGVLPAQYNPLLLTLRRGVSPLTGTVDVQDRIQTLKVGTGHRLQTKRGPIDDRRVIDFMALDVWTFYYPEADRDNFGVPFGQTQYRYEWFLGDRTSIVTSGWFDYFDIIGAPRFQTAPNNGLNVITAGVNINRPPRGTMFLGYSIVDTGPINTSALNTSFGYWMSPKWYSTFGGLYDFGEGMLLSTTFSLTRIGADFLTTVGLSYIPLQENYSFVLELVPRFSPRTRLGSAPVPFRPDLRFAPIQ